MRALSFKEFQTTIKSIISKNEYDRLFNNLKIHVADAMNKDEKTLARKTELLESAMKMTGEEVKINLQNIAKNMTSEVMSADPEYFWAVYYYFHRVRDYQAYSKHIDIELFGSAFATKFKRPVCLFDDEFAGIKWQIKESYLKDCIRSCVSEDQLDQYSEIIKNVVESNLAKTPREYEKSIVQSLKKEGLIKDDVDSEWIANALMISAEPNPKQAINSDEARKFKEDYESGWSFDPDWIYELAQKSEDSKHLSHMLDKIRTNEYNQPGYRQKLNLIKSLQATRSSKPFFDKYNSVSANIGRMMELNNSEYSLAFFKYSRARNFGVSGQADRAIIAYSELKGFDFGGDETQKRKRQSEIHYQLINTSYALRNFRMYGDETVSKQLHLPDNVNTDSLAGYNAKTEIDDFCREYGVDVENFNEQKILESTRALEGPSGVKIIYFYYLEKLLSEGLTFTQMREYYLKIVSMLKILSGTQRYGDDGQRYVTDAWYPLVFLHSVCGNRENFDLMLEIEKTMQSFDDWPNSAKIIKSVKNEYDKNSFLILLYQLNQDYGRIKMNLKNGLPTSIRRFSDKYDEIALMPSVSRIVNHGMGQMGEKYEKIRDIKAQTRPAISHWNYLIEGGEFHPAA